MRRIMVNERTAWWRGRRFETVHADAGRVLAVGHDEAEEVTRRVATLSALAHLAPRQRAVIVLRFLVNLSVEDTATTLGCSAGTVKSTCAAALARLRTFTDDLWKVS